MTEVLRSKLFYARSALMLAIPTFCHLSDLTKSEQGIVRQLLASASKQTALLSLMASSDAMMTRVMIGAILAKGRGRYASQEYFGRAWTLAGLRKDAIEASIHLTPLTILFPNPAQSEWREGLGSPQGL